MTNYDKGSFTSLERARKTMREITFSTTDRCFRYSKMLS